ncbi:S49 family peptidase [Metapseudomonas lalkuanensis]|uniref:S49 family peptidase n=1 Tax=Metapseudomonas lalkuanensis TaxID=2604832 RepID=A0A5J6QJ43_9GAMM|nr:S49 family peptidase [Pseudomonas lalkuanensis]QEY62534.1 S49 family peptidase [Pseudomonas lalkuanensis]
MKPTNLLARLFSRGQGGPLVSQIYSRAINRPLLVEPGMAETLIDGWLHGRLDAGEGGEPRQVMEKVGHIAVLEVSGPLISRMVEAPPCGTAPVSFEALNLAFDDIEADANITHVVLRLETPGGEAAQLFDLTDRMAGLRQTKTLIAMVDDYAYSGGYGLAAACSEIWLTRTGGVGSVGVVIGHKDVSEKNAKEGVKWTYVHSGALKVSGNPNEPLSDDARAFMQVESDRIYDLFTTSVATYRGMDVEAVRATEAGLFFGQSAIDVGLADHVGTFRELMTELQGGTYTRKRQVTAAGGASVESEEVVVDDLPAEQAEEGDGAGAVEVDPDSEVAGTVEETQESTAEGDAAAAADQPLAADAIAEQCQANGLSSMTATAIREKWTANQMAAAVARANEVRNLCTAAGMPQLAAGYINAATGVEVVRQELASRLAKGAQLSNRQSAGNDREAKGRTTTYAAVYARRNAR